MKNKTTTSLIIGGSTAILLILTNSNAFAGADPTADQQIPMMDQSFYETTSQNTVRRGTRGIKSEMKNYKNIESVKKDVSISISKKPTFASHGSRGMRTMVKDEAQVIVNLNNEFNSNRRGRRS